jgi:lipoprotein Spr
MMRSTHEGSHLRECCFIVGMLLIVLGMVAATGCSGASPRFTIARQPEPVASPAVTEPREVVSSNTIDLLWLTDDSSAINPAINRGRVLSEVQRLLGTPYASAERPGEGIDCSAFTARVFDHALNRTIPSSASQQYRTGRAVQPTERKFGDLIFFDTQGDGTPGHVGIYLGGNRFAHASTSQGVVVSSLDSAYYRQRYLGTRRIIE